MLDKLFNNEKIKDKGIKIIIVVIIIAVVLLSFDVFTQSKDGRRQIIDKDGGVEDQLCTILSDIDGVGNVDVMLRYDEDDNVSGAIVTAEGAGSSVVKNDLINAIMALFNITSSNVEVFEKKAVEESEEGKYD